MKKKIRALILLSGGLDSILAAKALLEQGIEVFGISFKSYFFETKGARKAAKNLGIPFKTIDFSKEHLELVKNPKHGYGKSANPCLDCHILMLKKAKEIMEGGGSFNKLRTTKSSFDFVATGEVLGERPMSQNKQALKTIGKETSLEGFLLRPLSAKLLPKTVPEEKSWVNIEELFAISGRSRKKQIFLAKKWGIKDYPTPAGGCLLTEPEFGKRLKELLKRYPQAKGNDIELLKVGRHFWKNSAKIVVGRDYEENIRIEKLAKKGDVLIELSDIAGPTTLVRDYGGKEISKDVLEWAKFKTKYYSTKARNKKGVEFKITPNLRT